MPSSEIQIDNTTNPLSAIMSLNLRRSYDEQLKISRNQFNKSRKRVESLKQKNKKCLNMDSPESQWISHGPIDSRDASLIFRASILNTHEEICRQLVSTTTASTTTVQQNKLNKNKSNGKILLPLTNSLTNNLEKYNQTTYKKKMLLIDAIKSPKKRLHESLSSSDTSISSECCENHDSNLQNDEQQQEQQEQQEIQNYKQSNEINNNNIELNEDVVNYEIVDVSKMPATKLNITFKFNNSETKLLRRIFLRHGLTETDNEINFNILWSGAHMKADILRNLTPYQRVNHFPRSYELTRKDRLYKNIEKLQHARGYKYFDIIPQSFILPLEYRDLVAAHYKIRGPWIVKPAASSRGRGIFIVKTPDQIPSEESVLVSKYVANPLCIDGHKCDLRLYVLVTSFDPLLIYVYEEGIVRLATVKYEKNVETFWNPCMHLTNYSINKYHSNYIKSNDADDEDVGHKWTLSALLRHLKNQKCDVEELMSNIEDLIIKSMFACAQSINSACRMFVPSGNNCFELYGFDILIDDALKPWLLEINLSPSLGIGSPLDTKVKASLMTDLLTLIGIPAYGTEMRDKYDKKWSRFKNNSYNRRTNSAEPSINSSIMNNSNSNNNKKSKSSEQLTGEEKKIIRNAKLQNARRGGFIRIFPTEDTMQRYSTFLDSTTGMPISNATNNTNSYLMVLQHNFNQLLFNEFYSNDGKIFEGNNFSERMYQYSRALETTTYCFSPKVEPNKCVKESSLLRSQLRQLIENGSEMTQLQCRQAFCLYLELVLKRLTEEPKLIHERIILKFLNRSAGGLFRTPAYLKNPNNYRVESKDRSALIAKLLNDYIEAYKHESDSYVDTFDSFGMIPNSLFNEFLQHANEMDLESILKIHTNITQTMPFLYNRYRYTLPMTPPIPSGPYGFLKTLPLMIPGANVDYFKIDSYTRNSSNQEINNKKSLDKLPNVVASSPLHTTTAIELNGQPKLNIKKKIRTAKSARGLSYERSKSNVQLSSTAGHNEKL